MAFISFTRLLVALGAFLLVRRAYFEATTGSRRRALAKQHGCLPPNKIPNKDPILGIDRFLDNLKAISEHRLLATWHLALKSTKSHTAIMRVLGGTLFMTDDPENLKTMLATKFDEWSIGRERINELSRFIGHGIFTAEGAAWKHSRDLLRPCFERTHVADVSIMEKHMSRLISLVPKDGTTVDLQHVFYKFTMDVSSEFLFGRSTNSLDPEAEKECGEFIKALEWCIDPWSREGNYWLNIVLTLFLPDPRFKRRVKIIQGM